jgi:hypothetical protein
MGQLVVPGGWDSVGALSNFPKEGDEWHLEQASSDAPGCFGDCMVHLHIILYIFKSMSTQEWVQDQSTAGSILGATPMMKSPF